MFGALGNAAQPSRFRFCLPMARRTIRVSCTILPWLAVPRACGGFCEPRARLLAVSATTKIQSTFVDEFRLMADFGPTVYYLSVGEYRRGLNCSINQADDGVAKLKHDYAIEGVSDATLGTPPRPP